jgi:hypothetical protein
MTAISKAWVTVADAAVDPDSPIDAQLMTGLRDDLINLREWLGASYFAGAIQDHNHDGANSALVPVGPNLLRNGSFENGGTAGWTITQYTGGTVATNTSNPLDGATSLAFTSTVLANGGGDATSNEYVPVTEGNSYSLYLAVQALASVANISSKAEILWYDKTKASVSASTVYSSSNTPIVLTEVALAITAPSTARFMRVKLTAPVPATGSNTGTIVFDGLVLSPDVQLLPLAAGGTDIAVILPSLLSTATSGSGTGLVELFNARINKTGTYRTSFACLGPTGSARIYKNGSAYGTLRTTIATFTEDLSFNAGDTIQLFAGGNGFGANTVSNFKVGVASLAPTMIAPVALLLGDR